MDKMAELMHHPQGKFLEMAQYVLQPRQYVSGETFYLLGRGVRLKVEKNVREEISSDGIYLYLCIKPSYKTVLSCAIAVKTSEAPLFSHFQ